MKSLIVNADDFGLAESINRGIIKGYKEGFISSTSLMCGAPAFDDAVACARLCPNLGLGIHLTLVGGVKPVLPAEQVPSLVTEEGIFPDDYILFAKHFYSGRVKQEELAAELQAQIERGLGTGLTFTHLDSHQHLHVLPGLQRLVLQLAKRYGFKAVRVPAEAYGWQGGFSCGAGRMLGKCGLTFWAERFRSRLPQAGIKAPDHFFGMVAGGHLDTKLVSNIIRNLPEGTSEIMTHPGLDAAGLSKKFHWGYHWEQELAAFLAPQNRALLDEQQIKLVNFGALLV